MANHVEIMRKTPQILCKNLKKILRKVNEKKCEQFIEHNYSCVKTVLFTKFFKLFQNFLTTSPPLIESNIFHYSTPPTITTTNKYNRKERV